ncbi:MAG: transglutaminase family protein, partial [Variovorax sp.]|nr:transglutaminase family protein [Variovorax sp.]
MNIHLGFEIAYQFPRPTPMILTLSIHYSRASDLVRPDHLLTNPAVPTSAYRDLFGNWCTRLVAPAGRFVLSTDTVVRDSGAPDIVAPSAQQVPVEYLPESTLVYLLGSRYCETDLLSDFAWQRFGNGPTGWGRVQAVCDFVHHHIEFGYQHARRTRSAFEAFNEGQGVCRDYAHLALTLCRCLNIPARYCTGYLGDVGTLPPYGTMDFAGWFEAFLGEWHELRVRLDDVLEVGPVVLD